MPHQNGLKVAWMTYKYSDWRVYALISGLILMGIGIIPLIYPESFYTIRFLTLRKIFFEPIFMSIAYIATGYGIVTNLRKRKLAFLMPLGVFLMLYFIYTQMLGGGLLKYGYTVVTCLIVTILMAASYFRGGGFSINSELIGLNISERELEIIKYAERASESARLARDSEAYSNAEEAKSL